MSKQTNPPPPVTARQGDFFGDAPRSFAPATVTSEARRIGVVDVGSNSVRMVVYEGHCRVPEALYNEKVMCGLGARLHETGLLEPEGKTRALKALHRFAALAPGLGIDALSGVATAAIREADDGPAFRDLVEKETGIRLVIASGADEARLAGQGVLFGNPSAEGAVADLGGASLELARIRRGRTTNGITTPLGPLRLDLTHAKGKAKDKLVDEIDSHLRKASKTFKLDGGTLYLVGGMWRALARVRMIQAMHPVWVVHEFRMSRDEAENLCVWLLGEDPKEFEKFRGVSSSRVAFLQFSAQLLLRIMHWIGPGDIRCSGFGLREGICFENLPRRIRRQDPLIAACKEQEIRNARAPGFGKDLGRWVQNILPPNTSEEARLMRAAAFLSDVNWRTHPDFRADGCWETATRISITDIGHEGRVWLGAALVVRYRNRDRKLLEENPQTALLNEEELERAIKLGLTLRLGATIAGAAPKILRYTRIFREGKRLILELGPEIHSLAGEDVEKRLGHLARAMKLRPELRLRG